MKKLATPVILAIALALSACAGGADLRLGDHNNGIGAGAHAGIGSEGVSVGGHAGAHLFGHGFDFGTGAGLH